MIASIAAAATEVRRWPFGGEGSLDLCVAGIEIFFEEFGGDDHHSALAEAAERSLFGNPCLLDRVKHVLGLIRRKALLLCPACGQTFERGDFLIGRYGRDRGDAGTSFFAVDEDGASSALCEPAAELGTAKLKIVAQDVE